MLDVLLLLSVPRRLLQSLDDQTRSAGDDADLGLTVLDGQLDGDSETLPVTGGLGDVFTDLLGRLRKGTERDEGVSGLFGWSFRVERLGTHKTQRTDLGGQSGRSSDLTSGGSEVDDLYEDERKTIGRQFPDHASKAENRVRKSAEKVEVEVDGEQDKAGVRRARSLGEGGSREDERQVHA